MAALNCRKIKWKFSAFAIFPFSNHLLLENRNFVIIQTLFDIRDNFQYNLWWLIIWITQCWKFMKTTINKLWHTDSFWHKKIPQNELNPTQFHNIMILLQNDEKRILDFFAWKIHLLFRVKSGLYILRVFPAFFPMWHRLGTL